MEKLYGFKPYDKGNHLGLLEAKEKAEEYLKKPYFNIWKDDPFLALQCYIKIIQVYGYNVIKKIFKEYEDEVDSGITHPTDDKSVIQTWVTKLSKLCGKDLRPYYQSWRIPHSDFKNGDLSKLEVFKQ